jgi:hypothetical protein
VLCQPVIQSGNDQLVAVKGMKRISIFNPKALNYSIKVGYHSEDLILIENNTATYKIYDICAFFVKIECQESLQYISS